MENIQKYPDGKYRWVYELKLLKNPTILLMLWKIFGLIVLGLWAFMVILDCGVRDFWWNGFLKMTGVMAAIGAGFLVLIALSYLIFAAIMGGKYRILFEMDDSGISHLELRSEQEKTQVIGELTAMLGALAKKPGVVGTGILAGTHTGLHTAFDRVKRVKAQPRFSVIRVNAPFSKNRVFAEPGEEYEFVCRYIEERTPNARK